MIQRKWVKVIAFVVSMVCCSAMASLSVHNNTDLDVTLSSNNTTIHLLVGGVIAAHGQKVIPGTWSITRRATKGQSFLLGVSSGSKHETASITPHKDSGEVLSVSGGDFSIKINDASQPIAVGAVIPENANISIELPSKR